MRSSSSSLRVIVGLLAIASATLISGCNKQGEGMRCDFDPDCEDGLRCQSVGQGSACCPPSGGAGVCSESSTATDSGTTTETSTTDTGTTETSTTSETGTTDTGSTPADTGSEDTGTTTTDAADAG